MQGKLVMTLQIKASIAILLLFTLNTAMTTSNKQLSSGYITLKKKPAPDFSLKDLDGKLVHLKQFKGRWIFLHFWASWCGPCRKELPNIQALVNKNNLKNFQFILINTAETEEIIFEFFAKLGIELETLLDQSGEVTEKYKPRGLPATFIITPNGQLLYLFFGGRPWHNKTYRHFLKQLETQSSDK